MKLEKIRQILTTSDPEQWSVISSFPSYRDNVHPLVDGEPIETHHKTAAYVEDVGLTMAWGMDPPGDKNPHDPEGGWTWWWRQGAAIYSFLVDVFYNSALVDRHYGARVEYACLPYPAPYGFGEVGEDAPIGWTVTQWQVDFFRLIHTFEYPTEDYDAHLERAQFVVDDSD